MMIANLLVRCPVPGADVVEDERELLHRGDDDLLAGLDRPAQVTGAVGVHHGGPDLHEVADGVADLLVEDDPVGDDDDRIECVLAVVLDRGELVGEPGDRVRLAAARGVLDEVPPARTSRGDVGEEPADAVELVVAREDLRGGLLAGLGAAGGDQLGVVLDDVRQTARGQDPTPQVVGLDAVGVGWVAGPVVPALVERKEPGLLALEVGAEPHLLVVQGEVRQAPAEAEDQLARVAVPLVLLDGVVERLLGDVVLQLERGDGQPVDERRQVEGECGLAGAVTQLPGDAEPVPGEQLGGALVPGRRGRVEEVEVVGAVLHAGPQHVHDAVLGDLALQPGQERLPGGGVSGQTEGLDERGLGRLDERGELDQVDGVGPVEVVRLALDPPSAVGRRHLCDDEGLQTPFIELADHRRPLHG